MFILQNGVSDFIYTVSMLEHSLRPIVNEFDYPAYVEHAKEYAKRIVLRNRTKFLSLPFYNMKNMKIQKLH